MGGKALNIYGVYTERKNTEEFKKIGFALKYKIKMTLNLNSEVVTCYRTKPDHGDLDLLIEVPNGRGIDWVEYIRERFKPQAINANGGVYSFDYDNFQIDFIPIIKSKWDVANTYFSYDPLGNIMGKTYHRFGLSYGWKGLFYDFRNFSGRNSQDILISDDVRKIFEFGGYDYDRYLLGFDTLEEIFQFCIDGKYFDVEMLQFANLKHIDKKRNRKRGSYHAFLQYLNDNKISTKYNFNRDVDSYLPAINNFFPEVKFMEKLEELRKKDSINKIISQKFNGDIVMQLLPNLKGRELGAAMGKFKNALGDNYDNFILNSDYKTISNYFMNVYNEE